MVGMGQKDAYVGGSDYVALKSTSSSSTNNVADKIAKERVERENKRRQEESLRKQQQQQEQKKNREEGNTRTSNVSAQPGSRKKSGPSCKSAATMDALLFAQTAGGSWQLTVELAKHLGYTLDLLTKETPNGVTQEQWATALVIVFLRNEFGDVEDEWTLIVAKALKFLGDTSFTTPLLAQAERLFQTHKAN